MTKKNKKDAYVEHAGFIKNEAEVEEELEEEGVDLKKAEEEHFEEDDNEETAI